MADDRLCSGDHFQELLADLEFHHHSMVHTSCVYYRKKDDTCLIVDTDICSQSHYPYVAYTASQNELVEAHDRVFRFLADPDVSPADLCEEIEFFLEGESDPEKVKRFGGNRTEQEPDPTLPEAAFEDCFLEAFGDQARMALHREFAYVDMEGKGRHIDYALFSSSGKFAIELNGESFHHPVMTGPRRYRSQLLKQNSLAADGFKVFRWSLNGMRDRERFILELKCFFGEARHFQDKSILKASREVFTLREHQQEALQHLAEERSRGRRTFLLVLPTGTGKTEIFIEDMVRLKEQDSKLKSLIIVPTRKLRKQTLARLKLRLPPQHQESTSDSILGDSGKDFFVQTSAYLQRHYYQISPDCYDYIVVDEAHHSVARGLRSILEHFVPTHLIGVTATPERFDQQRLEKMFGEYEPQMTLKDAICQGLVPPVRCFRIKSNIDLSEIRFNGREYMKNDLQRTLLVPSRDRLVADVVKRYFGGEFSRMQGVVFCVDIKHARRMAKLFNSEGIAAAAVDGRDRANADRQQEAYDRGDIRFLCACDLLTEGWDAPQTSILIMARPTFSKVLYTQQLGRGLRNHPGKEALYVIDVVDNYGARLKPFSLHALFKIPNYQPFDNLIDPDMNKREEEIIVLDGLYEGERRVEPVDIFSFEEMYGSYLNEEQLARELFVSTGTVRVWLRQGKIRSDVRYPFGRQQLHFFDPDRVVQIRQAQGLREHTAETRLEDFQEFLEKRDYTFSYKIIFFLAFLKSCNQRFEASLPDMLELYQRFYLETLDKHGKNERSNCPYNRRDVLEDLKKMQRSLLENPFEKFERKRFFYHCKDLNYLALDPGLINNLGVEHYQQMVTQLTEDLHAYYRKLEITLEEEDYSFLLPDSYAHEEGDAEQSLFCDVPPEEDKFTRVLPYYPLSIAAGDFMDYAVPDAPETWFVVEGLTGRRTLASSMFVARVQGKSMEPLIPDGAYCLFTFEVGGSRNGRIILAQQADISDQDTGASYTVKSYQSSKKMDPDSGWQHESITLKAVNPAYDDIIILPEESEDFRVVAFFVEVLTAEA